MSTDKASRNLRATRVFYLVGVRLASRRATLLTREYVLHRYPAVSPIIVTRPPACPDLPRPPLLGSTPLGFLSPYTYLGWDPHSSTFTLPFMTRMALVLAGPTCLCYLILPYVLVFQS